MHQNISVSREPDNPLSSLMELILSGELKIGDRIPSVQELEKSLGVSPEVLQAALPEMEARGLLEVVPDGTMMVSDYRIHGSKALISGLLAFQPHYSLSLDLTISLVELLILLETDAARLAATNRSEAQLAQLQELLAQASMLDAEDIQRIIELEFEFHLLLAVSSGNLVYPVIINAFKEAYIRMTMQFHSLARPQVYQELLAYQRGLVQAIQRKQPRNAADMMRQMLDHEDVLMRELKNTPPTVAC